MPLRRPFLSSTRFLLLVALAACGGDRGGEVSATYERSLVGTCNRELPALDDTPHECGVLDLACPCGSHCDVTLGFCTYDCMPPDLSDSVEGKSGNPAPCEGGDVCDDEGRCVGPDTAPPAVVATLAAAPASLTTVPSGAAKSFDVTLTLGSGTPPAQVTAAKRTTVRVVGRYGAEVSCDNGSTFHIECSLSDFTFSPVTAGFQARKAASVRTVAGTEEGRGDVLLDIDATAQRLVVPALARLPLTSPEGVYSGIAVSADYPAGLPVTARVKDGKLLVRESTRILAPEGALLLDVSTAGQPAPLARRTVWLRDVDATDGSAGGVVGEYVAGVSTFDLEARTLKVPVKFNVPGASGLSDWNLDLLYVSALDAECNAVSTCAGGQVCAPGLAACVPSAVWTPTTTSLGNQLDDSRSATWWNAALPLLQTDGAFSTSGPDLVESVLCAATPGVIGHLGVTQLALPGKPSRSGDLACADYYSGAPNLVPGAVGLVTLADRSPLASDLQATNLLTTCLADLKRSVGTDFSSLFAPSVGNCVNLARSLVAFRLLGSDPLGKGTQPYREPRARGLLVRLTQEWAMLHGYLASAGLSQVAADDGLTLKPAADSRAALLKIFDHLERGWGALLDRRTAGAVRDAVSWAPASENDSVRDYRLAKKPAVYFPINAGEAVGWYARQNLDIYTSNPLILQNNGTWGRTDCGIDPNRSALVQGFDCPGFTTLYSTSGSSGGATSLEGPGYDNVSITINVDTHEPSTLEYPDFDVGDGRPHRRPPPTVVPPPYRGGTLVATSTLALAEAVDPTTSVRSLVVAHPIANGGVEFVTFSGYGALGETPDGVVPNKGNTVAVVRDAVHKTYTLYVYRSTGLFEQTKAYVNDPVGVLDVSPYGRVLLGAVSNLPDGHYWKPYSRSYPGTLDDLAIFDSALSRTEVLRFAGARGFTENLRTIWPADMTLASSSTQEIVAPLGAQLLETQVAELELAARLVDSLSDRVQIACEGDPDSAREAKQEIDGVVVRVGRMLRQSYLVAGLAAQDTSDRAQSARKLIAAKRIQIARALQPARCVSSFGLAENEVPLYSTDISPNLAPKAAYFASSDYLLTLAEARAGAAKDALEAARHNWDAARLSKLQEEQSQQMRDMRVEDLKGKYGDGLRRLCGISGQTSEDVIGAVLDPESPGYPFSVETCFVQPTTRCLAQHNGPIRDVDPSCYRGALGSSLMETRTAAFAYDAAKQSWMTAVANAEAAEKFCVWKEMDAYGCSAVNRHKLSGVTCPAGFQGTQQLAEKFNDWMDGIQRTKAIVTGIGSVVSGILGGKGNPGLGGFGYAGSIVAGFTQAASAGFDAYIDEERRAHEEVMSARAVNADIQTCWNQADQFQRAIAGAEDSMKQALAQSQASGLAFDNALAEARQIVLEAPIVIDRELTRATIPFAFHYWVSEYMNNAQTLFESARRYTYLALRATEYDTQSSYAMPADGMPSRGAVLSATNAYELLAQLNLLRGETGNRLPSGRTPKFDKFTFDFGEKFFGLTRSSADFGKHLYEYLRPVYSPTGAYLGMGVKFSLIPGSGAESPTWRCGERIWRVNVGATGVPANPASDMHVKLIKSNVFASRQCGQDGALRVASFRPQTNLLAGAGEAGSYKAPDAVSIADLSIARFEVDSLYDFTHRDDAWNGSSTELSLYGMYGDYVLVFPEVALGAGLDPSKLRDFNFRFDYLSVENMQVGKRARPDSPENQPTVEPVVKVDESSGPIVVQ